MAGDTIHSSSRLETVSKLATSVVVLSCSLHAAHIALNPELIQRPLLRYFADSEGTPLVSEKAANCGQIWAVLHFAHHALSGSNLSRFAGVWARRRNPERQREISRAFLSGSNSVVESRLPKPLVAGSIPVSRSKLLSVGRLTQNVFRHDVVTA